MLLLPKKVGSYTLQRKLGTGGIAESYIGTHDANGGRAVVVRRVLPYVLRDTARLASVDARVRDLLGVRHPFLVHVLESFAEGEDHYLVEEYVDGVNLEKVLSWCRQHQHHIPHNVFLNIATQVCNGLEALHGRTGKGTSAEHVLHLAIKPNSLFITRDGKVMVGGYGLTRSPTTLPHGGVAGPVPTRMEYLSPEQTHPDQKLTPASDVFSLGAVLYELLTLDPLFRADSNLQTIHRVRRAEVTSQLLRVKEQMPGLDKVLYRALSLNPRHRYQRAFVLREDLRGLMAGYSFATIAEDTRTFLAPLLESVAGPAASVDSDAGVPTDVDPQGADADADLSPAPIPPAMAPHPAAPLPPLDPVGVADAGEHTEHTSPRAGEDPPTEHGQAAWSPPRDDLDRPTLPGQPLPDLHEGTAPASARRAPPDPTVSQPDLHRLPPPPPVQLAPAPLPAPVPIAAPLDDPGSDTGEPENTAAHLSPPLGLPAPAFGGARPSDTAAWISQPAQPPSPPPALAPAAARPAPTPPLPPPAAPFGPPPTPALTPVAPAPPALSSARPPEPPPAFVAPPKPFEAPKPAAVSPPPPVTSPPTLSPPSVQQAPQPTQQTLVPPPPAPSPAASADPFVDAPPPTQGSSWVMVGGALAALLAVLVCGGGALLALTAEDEAVATTAGEPAPPPAEVTPAPGAAAVMAEAPPRVEPIDADATADASLATAQAPAAAPPSNVASPPPIAPPAPAVAAAPERTPPPPAPAPAAAPRTAAASAPPPAAPRSSAPVASSAPSGSSSSSAAARTTSPPPARPAPAADSAPPPARATPSAASTTRVATSSGPPARPSQVVPEPTVDVSVEETAVSDLDQYVDNAKKGKLQSTDIAVLEMVETQAPDYTRSRALLLMNAQRKSDDKGTRKYLDELMLLPENQYNPVYLTDYARWHVNHAEYDKALEKATLAERYWSRIPPELVFSKKAEIYEIQAAAWQGKFYKSDEDMDLLASAIKGWERYRQHVSTRSRSDLQQRADTELARLQDIKEKLQ